MKTQADKKRTDRVFNVGDMVFLRLQPYVQSSLAPRSHHKLCFKFFSPFEIIEKVGPVAYKLKLPTSSSIHPVFNVSLLKATPAASVTPHSELPELSDALQVPKLILQKRLHLRGNHSVP